MQIFIPFLTLAGAATVGGPESGLRSGYPTYLGARIKYQGIADKLKQKLMSANSKAEVHKAYYDIQQATQRMLHGSSIVSGSRIIHDGGASYRSIDGEETYFEDMRKELAEAKETRLKQLG